MYRINTFTVSLINILLVQGRTFMKNEASGGDDRFSVAIVFNNIIDKDLFVHSEGTFESGGSQTCQGIKGLPEPASGCCGVQFKDVQNYGKASLPPVNTRLKRSTDRDTLPYKMINRGINTDIHAYPWTVHLYKKRPYNERRLPGLNQQLDTCGGAIISTRFVLTAAHCVHQVRNASSHQLSLLTVVLAEYDTNTRPRDCISRNKCIENEEMSVERFVIHPEYNDTVLQNDIALVKVTTDIPYTEFIRPICLPTTDVENLGDTILVIVGWGEDRDGRLSNFKQAAAVNYVTNEACKEAYSYKDDSLSCLLGEQGEDICPGDSGGPVMVYADNKYFLAGVISSKRNGIKCGSPVPSLFSNVFYHKNWIVRGINKDD